MDCNSCHGANFTVLRSYPGFQGTDVVECQSCKLWQAQPLPSEDFLSDFYQKDFGKKLPTLTHKHEKGYQRRAQHQLHFIQSFVPISRETHSGQYSVLDVGCHAGTLLSLFKRKGWRVVGIDPNPRSRYSQQWYDIKVVQELFTTGMFSENSFDLILHSHALEHVRSPRDLLVELYRIL